MFGIIVWKILPFFPLWSQEPTVFITKSTLIHGHPLYMRLVSSQSEAGCYALDLTKEMYLISLGYKINHSLNIKFFEKAAKL